MAVKPITNKQLVDKQSINRAEQISFGGEQVFGGNSAKSINPGINYNNNYAVTLKDVDTSIIKHIKDVMRLKIENNGETKDVPVLYANQERWVNARKNNFLKDRTGAIMIPLIMLKRTAVEKSSDLPVGMEHDVNRKYTKVVRNSGWSKDNRYDRFAVQTGKKPIIESIITGVPDYVNITYEFVLWTNFIEQMNILLEAFIEQDNNYWGGSTNYKFISKIDSLSDATEMTIDSERFIKSNFNLSTNAYLLPEYVNNLVGNKVSQTQRQLTAGKVIFGFESDATDEQVGK